VLKAEGQKYKQNSLLKRYKNEIKIEQPDPDVKVWY